MVLRFKDQADSDAARAGLRRVGIALTGSSLR
jgi:hypothetical protein